MSPNGYDCIVLAAGASRRMGRAKLYLPFEGATIIEATVGAALEAGARVIVVAREEDERIADLLGSRASVVRNPDPERGMISSLREGLRLVSAGRFFFLPGDLPFIRSSVYRRLAAAEATGPVIPTSGGRRGHPVLMPSSLIPAIMSLPDDVPLKTLISENSPLFVDVADDSVLRDIDTPEEYRSATGQSA